VLSGPSHFNAPEIFEEFLAQRALYEVTSAQTLAQRVVELINSPSQRSDMGAAASQVVQQGRGALNTVLTLIKKQTGNTLP
jgi:3-deoxy-D-manno-octulosonic-acid transferase